MLLVLYYTLHYSQETKSSLIADNIYQYQTLDLKYSSPFSSRLTGLDWASARSNEVSEWGASLTRICSAAFRSCILTGTTCTVVSKQALDSDEPQSSNNFWNIARHLIGHSDAKRKIVDYLLWVTERIFIHHIAGCENCDCWSHCTDTSLKSGCGDSNSYSMWSKVYNLHRSFQD